MNILVIGASGNIGSRIVKEALTRGHAVTAAVRRPERIVAGGSLRTVSLDALDVDATCTFAREADVIVCALSPRGGGDPMAEATAFGAALIEVARRTARRLMVVGGAGSLVFPDGSPVAETLPDFIRPESMAMRKVRDTLQASDVDWTFFSPAGFIFPGERTGIFRLGTTTILSDRNKESRISIEDYAVAFVDEIERPAHRRSQMTIAY